MALSFIVVFLYGGLVWFAMPTDPEISWEGHLSGLIVGVAFSFIYTEKIEKPPKYDWEKKEYNPENDAFMQHFDKEGNFIENVPQEEESIQESEYKYIYKSESEESKSK